MTQDGHHFKGRAATILRRASAEFEADLAIDADRRETHRLVERDASRIWQCDAGK
jgi:hypothetical protein